MQASTRTPGQLYALVIGAIYLLVGVVGFFFASEFTEGSSDDQFIILRLNHLHNLVHVALGVGWLAASRAASAAKSVNTLFGIVLLLVAILGFTGVDLMHTLLNITESPAVSHSSSARQARPVHVTLLLEIQHRPERKSATLASAQTGHLTA
jgi:hypothetical protein